MKPKFFESLDYHRIVLERGFLLLKQRKITGFSKTTIHDIIEGDHETLKALESRPSILSKRVTISLDKEVEPILALNSHIDLR